MISVRHCQDHRIGGKHRRETPAGNTGGKHRRETPAGNIGGKHRRETPAGNTGGKHRRETSAGNTGGQHRRETLAGKAQKKARGRKSRAVLYAGASVSELCQMHVSLFGQSLMQSESLLKGMAGLTLLGNLQVVPHELLVVGVHAVLDDALGTLCR